MIVSKSSGVQIKLERHKLGSVVHTDIPQNHTFSQNTSSSVTKWW